MSAEDLVTLLLSRGQPAREEENDEEDDAPPDRALRLHVEQLRALPYTEYLKTDHWQEERTGALKRAGYHCQVCRASNVQLEVHHNTYARLGCEEPGDLLVLCNGCHELFSKSGRLSEGKRGGMEDGEPGHWDLSSEDDDHPVEPVQESTAYIPPPKLSRSAWKYEEYYAITKEAYRLGYTGKRKLADFIREYGKHFKVDPVGYGKALDIINEMQEREMLEDDEEEEESEE
jgi:hypothetical protein